MRNAGLRRDVQGAVAVDWGIVLTVIFGGLSFYQSIQRVEQQRALRTFSQGMYNTLWRVGDSAESLKRCNDSAEAKQFATGINELSRSGRNFVISLGKEYAIFVPYPEAAWEPKPLPERKRFWRRLFVLTVSSMLLP
jgi:hypothetical protein